MCGVLDLFTLQLKYPCADKGPGAVLSDTLVPSSAACRTGTQQGRDERAHVSPTSALIRSSS